MYRTCCLLVAAATAVALYTAPAQAQQAPSLLPLPQVHTNSFSSTQTSVHPISYFEKGKKDKKKADKPMDMPPPVAVEQDPPSVYEQAMSSNWGGDCASCLPSACADYGYWFGGVYGLYMTRDHSNDLVISCDDAATNVLISTQDADMGWEGGTEVRFGRTFCGGQYAWEAVYWGIYPDGDGSEANVFWTDPRVTNQLGTHLSLDNLDRGDALGSVDTLVVGAERHKIRRDYEFHNVEINLLNLGTCGCYAPCGGCNMGCDAGCGGCCAPRYNLSTFAGVRFMKLDESFQFASDAVDTSFGTDLANENYYDVETQNFLIGVQLGSRGDLRWTDRFSTFGAINLGLYGNHMRQEQRVYNGLGQVATVNNGYYDGAAYDIVETKNDVAFLGEARLGVSYQLSNCWQLTAGYRAVALTGVALATEQIPVNFHDLDEARRINSNGSMILHGAFFGAEAKF
ncbi:MAG: BBP7 family outer membrane beta-barrel protein [Planctomycetales bacterium]|nr:BBP7 family outer membrane beta-barrel protein [Planctomycetales bacterium]